MSALVIRSKGEQLYDLWVKAGEATDNRQAQWTELNPFDQHTWDRFTEMVLRDLKVPT